MNSLFYPYKVFLSSGHVFQVYREESDEMKLWESVKELRSRDIKSGFSYFCFNKENNMVAGVLDPHVIIGIDRAFGIRPIDLDERKKQIEEAKARASESRPKTRVGSSAIDITARK